MKPLLGIFSAILVGSLIMLYLFRGFGPGETGALFRSNELPIPVSYFKTPATAVTKVDAILATQDWPTLTQYYELEGSGVDIARLVDGSFFFSGTGEGAQEDLRNYLHPFPPGARLYEARPLGVDDRFEVDVVWKMDLPWAKDQEHLTTFVLRRYPEGYRILTDRTLTRPLEALVPNEPEPEPKPEPESEPEAEEEVEEDSAA
jgi:hypothetical protein